MTHLEHVANQLAIQRNQALNAQAESEARLAAATAEIAQLRLQLGMQSKPQTYSSEELARASDS
jgi:hypothetical protein